MPDWLFSRPLIIGLAIVGGAISLLASWCRARGVVSEQQVVLLNKAAYAFMGVSMVLFVAAGIIA